MVKTNDITQFKFVDDILPNDEVITNVISNIPTRLSELINNVINNTPAAFLELYSDDYSLRPLSSPVLRRLAQVGTLRVIGDVYVPTSAFYEFLFKALDSRYYEKWNNIYTALSAKYEILKPYNMKRTETETNILGTTTDMDKTHSQSTTETNRDTTTNTSERTIANNRTQNDNVTEDKSNSKDSVYGFNSSTPVGSNETANEGTSKRNITDTENNTDNLSGTVENTENNTGSQSGTQSTDIRYDSNRSISRTIERNGTTGNILYQEMIQKELELRDYLLYKVMFKDISEYLTLGIYY